jgi:hypothetical protein
LPVSGAGTQQEAVHLNLQALRNFHLQLGCLAYYIRGANLQDCKTGKLAAAIEPARVLLKSGKVLAKVK